MDVYCMLLALQRAPEAHHESAFMLHAPFVQMNNKVPSALHLLVTSPLAPLGGLEDLGALVIPAEVILVLAKPVPLMLQCGLVLVQIPWRAGHVLGDMGVNLSPILILAGRSQTGFTCFIQLLLTATLIRRLMRHI